MVGIIRNFLAIVKHFRVFNVNFLGLSIPFNFSLYSCLTEPTVVSVCTGPEPSVVSVCTVRN